MEEKKNTKKTIVICSIAAVLVIVAIVVVVVIKSGKKSYRIINVYELNGSATVSRTDIGDIDVYENMIFESGDKVNQKEGTMTLKLDEDKYMYVEEDTEFVLKATGDKKDSRTTIELTKGQITNEIQNKLSEDSAYEINTPNSTMSVRGTIFYAYYYVEDGVEYTRVCVFDGTVNTSLVYPDGKVEKETGVKNGYEVTIYHDDKNTDYVGAGATEIDYSTIPTHVLEVVQELADEGRLSLDDKEYEDIKNLIAEAKNPGPFTVTFLYNGEVFGSQTVEKDALVAEPSLMPEAGGSWDFDFSTPITEDTEINWK